MRAPLAALSLVALLLLAPALAPAAPLAAQPRDAALAGHWLPWFEGQVAAVSMSLLKDGRVLYWSGVETGGPGNDDWIFFHQGPAAAKAAILDLGGATPQVTQVSYPGHDLFCAGHTALPDGRILAVGGTRYTNLTEAGAWDILYGEKDARLFDPATGAWSQAQDMAHGRWYPSLITLPDGDAFVASGIGTLTDPATMVEGQERYDPATGAWSAEGSRLLPMYPRLLSVPRGPLQGQVFYSTVGTLWGPFGAHPLEAQWSLQQAYDPATQAWSTLGPSLLGARQHGAAVLLPLDPAKGWRAEVLTFGGTLQRSVAATPLAEIADLGVSPPANRPAAPMHWPRWHLNGVLLPDGQVLAVGGALYDNVVVHGQPDVPILPAELYDPAADAWTALAPMEVPRMYHSTALLLPDARVLVGGHVPLPVPWKTVRDAVPGQAQVVETRLEVFEPPYLFRGPRPAIAAAPATLAHNQTFNVTLAGAAADILSAVLVRPGATTHSFDSEQRVVVLQRIGDGGSELALRAPPDAHVAPPGHYMLFVNKATPQGPVPSVAAWVQLG